MRAALITGREQLEFREFPLPEHAEPGAAVVQISRCGVCGSDVSAFRSDHPYPPYLSGHEWGGTVLSVGDGVAGLSAGDRVIAGVSPACGHCALCRAGIPERCEGIMAVARGQHPLAPPHGGYAERISVPADMLLPIPDAIDDGQAAMVEPATVALHAVRRRPPRIGEVAVVLGAGPIGLFALQLLRIAGARRVIMVEPHARRRSLAVTLGADGAVPPGDEAVTLVQDMTGGLGADVVFDCAGTESALRGAADLCRPAATIMLVGVAASPFAITPGVWLSKELTIGTSLVHLNHEFTSTIEFIASGRLVTESLHDLTIGLDRLAETLTVLAHGGDFVKVLVDPHA